MSEPRTRNTARSSVGTACCRLDAQEIPNSEIDPGSTGYQPVPSGHWPDGTGGRPPWEATSETFPYALPFRAPTRGVSGRGTGRLPVLPGGDAAERPFALWTAPAERQRRRRFRAREGVTSSGDYAACESGVALRWPPQSIFSPAPTTPPFRDAARTELRTVNRAKDTGGNFFNR